MHMSKALLGHEDGERLDLGDQDIGAHGEVREVETQGLRVELLHNAWDLLLEFGHGGLLANHLSVELIQVPLIVDEYLESKLLVCLEDQSVFGLGVHQMTYGGVFLREYVCFRNEVKLMRQERLHPTKDLS